MPKKSIENGTPNGITLYQMNEVTNDGVLEY
jgi:hypothetical protein